MILIFIQSLLASWWFVNFEPLQNFLDRLIITIDKEQYRLPDWLYTMLGCWKCMSFWTALIYSQSFIVACTTSLTAVCLNKLIYNS
jgi:hypothetical protein